MLKALALLEKGTAPTLSQAPSSMQHVRKKTDATSIRREIADQVPCVDHAIHVLLTAGMSTPALRDIARTVRIEHAAFSEITAAVFLLGPVAFAGFAANLLQGVNAGEHCLPRHSGGYICAVKVDSVAFALSKSLGRAALHSEDHEQVPSSAFLGVSVHNASCHFPAQVQRPVLQPRTWLLIGDICSVPTVFFAFLGIRGLASLPLGLTVLQIFFSRGNNVLDALRSIWPSRLVERFPVCGFHSLHITFYIYICY